MAIREDVVASAAKFLQDPTVASSPVENRIAFLQAKNLTQDEVNAALARAASDPGSVPAYAAPPQPVASRQVQQPPYYGQYPPYAWQPPPPPEVPRRDWRDYFILATVMGGVSYGLYALSKRYIYPLIAPPTPERLEQDKKSIDEQFERAFALVEQLAKDTEQLKAAENERTERLDTALADLESVINDLKSANRRREDDAQRVRDDVQGLKDTLPKALDAQKDTTDNRLKEVNTELKSLKTLISQRMNAPAQPASTGGYLRPSSGNANPAPAVQPEASSTSTGNNENTAKPAEESKTASLADYTASLGRSSPFGSGMGKRAIPDWQKSMSTQGRSSSPTTNGAGASSSATQETEN